MTSVSQVATAQNGAQVGAEMCALAGLISRSAPLARALARANVPAAAKVSLLRDITGGLYAMDTLALVAELDDTSLRTQSAFVSAVCNLATTVVFAVAKNKDELDQLQESLDAIAIAVHTNDALSDALRSPDISDANKSGLLEELFGTRAPRAALALVKLVITRDHGRDFADGIEALAQQAIAVSGRVLADVTTAIEIDNARKNRLTAAIAQRVGQPVKARFGVDPSIMGSVIVRVGDEVWDGSVRNRLEQARSLMKKAS